MRVPNCVRPHDWPESTGDIDLAVQDLPHRSADTEWWYVNGHVQSSEGKEYSFFASFFRIVADWNKETLSFNHLHALTWAIVDPTNHVYMPEALLDK